MTAAPGWKYGLYRARLGASRGLYDIHTVDGVYTLAVHCAMNGIPRRNIVSDKRPGDDFQ